MRKFLLLLFFYLFSGNLWAQTIRNAELFYWPKYNNLFRIQDNWLLITELEGLRSVSPHRQRQALARITLIREFGNGFQIGLGFAHNRVFDTDTELWEPEWRPHQQLELLLNNNRLQLEQRLRIEQQFIRRAEADSERLQAGHSFSLRTRYQAQLIYNFREESGTKGNLALFLRDEVYAFPFGQEVFLSQNRSSLGMIFQPYEKLSLEPSYMLMLLQPSPSVYEHRHVINLSFIHFLNL